MSDVISLADHRRSGLEWPLIERFASGVIFSDDIIHVYYTHLIVLSKYCRRGCEHAQRCWRLVRKQIVDPAAYVDQTAASDALVCVMAQLEHWGRFHWKPDAEGAA